jgi:WD40 repeat protein
LGVKKTNATRGQSWKELFKATYISQSNWRNGKYSEKIIEPVSATDEIEQFHFEGDTLIACTYDGILRVYDIPSGSCKHTIEQSSGEIVWFDFHKSLMVTAHLDVEAMNLWDINTGKKLKTLNSPAWVNTFCFKGDHLICGEAGVIRDWDMETGKIVQTVDTPNEININIWLSDQVVLCESEHSIRAFDLRTFDCIQTTPYANIWGSFLWYEWDMRAPTIYTPVGSGDIYKWDVNSREKICELKAHKKKVVSAYLEGGKLASSSYDKVVHIWDVNNVVNGESPPLVKIDVDEVVWGIETEDNRMVGLKSANTVCVWQF